MKLKKIISGVAVLSLALVCFITLSSCAGAQIEFNDNNSTTISNIDTPVSVTGGSGSEAGKGTVVGTPTYENTSYELTTTSLAEGEESITTVVNEIVDACVSITASSSYSISSGSGVLVAEDTKLGLSYIVTCFHVISDSSVFSVTDDDGNEYEAALVGGYEDEDLAVLSIEKTGLKYATLIDNSDNLLRGMDVICIGNPLGTLPNSVSRGNIAYVNRVIAQNAYTDRTLIQTDVAINSGNSGGGLFSSSGALIGIVSNKYSSSSIDNLGFAIPANMVSSTIESILNTAEYDTTNKVWKTGYVQGDYEYAFTLSIGQIGGFFSRTSYVIYISDVESNETYSGASVLKSEDILNSITINFKDSAKEKLTYTVGNITSTTVVEIMQFLKSANLEIGDSLTFNVTRNNEKKDVTFEIVQFVYSI